MVAPGLDRATLNACLMRPDTTAWALTHHLPPESRFRLPPHIRYLSTEIVDAIRTPGTQMTIEAPVRHGKSELLSRWTPAWFLGTFPNRRVILASYGSDFAGTWGGKVRDIIDEFGEAVWGIRVNPGSKARNRWDIEGKQGGMVTAGTDGGITGKGAHLLLIDDPFKDSEEALSAHVRKQKWDWLMGTALTRLEPGGVCIILQARWHEDDMIGRCHDPEFMPPDAWRRVRVPALAEEGDPLGREIGEALWPARYDADELNRFREQRGSYWFGALYQQSPVPLGGGIFKREHFRTYHRSGHMISITRDDTNKQETYDLRSLVKFQTWDLAVKEKTTSDFTVCLTVAVSPKGDLFVLDVLRVRVDGADHANMVHAEYARHLPAWVGIETVQYQATLLQTTIRAGLPIRELHPDKDKVSRALTAAARYEAHAIFHPAEALAPWLVDYEKELVGFQGTYDDQVDTIAYAADALIQNTLSPAWAALLQEQAA